MRIGWHSRGYLPHLEAGERLQFLTWRLADSLPKHTLDQWIREVQGLPDSVAKQELLHRTGNYLDEGHGDCLLRNPSLARIVQETLLAKHDVDYRLVCWVVMPNHVHAMLSPLPGNDLARIVKRLKGASARYINLERGQSGTIWHPDYWDKLIRDEAMFERIRKYIEWNPVKARLCLEPRAWPYSSASETMQERLRSAEIERGVKD